MSMTNETNKGDLQTALKNALELLARDPHLAQEQAEEILKVYPDTPKAKRILASAYRLQTKPQRGLDVLTPLLAEFRDSIAMGGPRGPVRHRRAERECRLHRVGFARFAHIADVSSSHAAAAGRRSVG